MKKLRLWIGLIISAVCLYIAFQGLNFADFWTVVLEASFENLDEYFAAIAQPAVRAEMDGYLDLVDSGNRRLYRVVAER